MKTYDIEMTAGRARRGRIVAVDQAGAEVGGAIYSLSATGAAAGTVDYGAETYVTVTAIACAGTSGSVTVREISSSAAITINVTVLSPIVDITVDFEPDDIPAESADVVAVSDDTGTDPNEPMGARE